MPCSRRSSTARAAFVLAAALALARPAAAGPTGAAADLFRGPLDPYGVQNILGAEALPELRPFAAVVVDRAWNPVEGLDPLTGRQASEIVHHVDVAALNLALGLPLDLEAGIHAPLVLGETGERPDDRDRTLDVVSMGDLRLDAKWSLARDLRRELAFAVDGFLTLPTGDDSRFRGDGKRFTGGGIAVIERRFEDFRVLGDVGAQLVGGHIDTLGYRESSRILLGAAGAYVVYRDREYGSSGRTPPPIPGMPRAFAAGPPLELDLEASVDAAMRMADPRRELTSPIELYLGLRLDTPIRLSLEAGVSAGLTQAMGASDARLFAGIAYLFGGTERQDWHFRPGQGPFD